jgi:acid phosphatase class B
MLRDADKEGKVSNTNSEVAEMTLLSFAGSDVSCVAYSKTSYLQQRHIAV